MSVPVRLLRVAQDEYDEAVDWYEARQEGLGASFFAALEKTLEKIGEKPDRNCEVYPGSVKRSFRVGRIVCTTEYAAIAWFSVFHSSRDPAIWQWRRDQE